MADLISRAEAVRALASSNSDYLDAWERLERLPAVDAAPVVMAGAELTDAELIEAIRKAPITLKPAVDAAPVVHGRWVFHDDDMMPWVSCSECGVCTDSMNKTPYCPYCAAKMDNGGEDGAVYSKLENAE